jgi:hypothetical protein
VNHDLDQKIRERAHRLWEADGRPHGRHDEHWAEAERQVMAEEGLGEPVGASPEIEPGNRPEPQPEIPADPLRNPEVIAPGTDPEYPATPGPQEMPANRAPNPEIPAESGIAEVPQPAPGAADTARVRAGGRKKAAAEGTAATAEVPPALGTTPATPGAADAARKRGAKAAPASAPTEPTAATEAKGRGGRGGGKNRGSAASV